MTKLEILKMKAEATNCRAVAEFADEGMSVELIRRAEMLEALVVNAELEVL